MKAGPNHSRSDILMREEWDFSSCAEGRELDCWCYEYARESPSVIQHFREAVKHPVCLLGKNRDATFDEDGSWNHRIDIFDSDGEFEDQIYLHLAPGFPGVPFLKTKHNTAKTDQEDYADFFPPSVRDASDLANTNPQPLPHYFVNLYIKWDVPNKGLIKDFSKWLNEHRPFPARSRRGKSPARANLAELKALGAYRLLKTMTAPAALAYTEKFISGGLYAKCPDWYEARRRAKRILDYWFM